ncbi:MAG: hypothetical protein MUO34_11565 [Ignavibacteriaceae bacterium]|nr:hypothetical protein [Ignavibacteriaceae bacterium]
MKNTMLQIDIRKLTSCGSDWETNQYLLLRKIKEWQELLAKNIIYPVLQESELVKDKLDDLLIENIGSKSWLEREVRAILIEDQIIVQEKAKHISTELDKLINYVEWAIENVEYIIREARIIFDFIKDDISINHLNSDDKYRGKGYFVVQDNKKEVVKIYLYEMIISWTYDHPIENIKFTLLRSIPSLLMDSSIEELMEKFVVHSQKMYKPMVYVCKTDLDFSFNESILPALKTRLLKEITN